MSDKTTIDITFIIYQSKFTTSIIVKFAISLDFQL